MIVPAPYTLRPTTGNDRDWLRCLHHTVYRDVVERQFGWDQAWQDENFERTFDSAKWQIVQVEGRDAGALAVERRPEEIFLEGIEIVPEYQGQGLGTAMIHHLQREAEAAGLPVTLRVLLQNRARLLYERLGFAITGRTETHYLMRWFSSSPSTIG